MEAQMVGDNSIKFNVQDGIEVDYLDETSNIK